MKGHLEEIVDCLLESYDDIDKEFAPKIAEMILRYEKYARGGANNSVFTVKDGEIILSEYAVSRTSVECGYSGAYLRDFIKTCAIKGVLKN